MLAESNQLQVLLTLATDLKEVFNASGKNDNLFAGVFGCMATTMSLAQRTIKVQISQQREIEELKKAVATLKKNNFNGS